MDRAQVPEWIAEQNALVLGDEPCSHFLLVNVANEDIIGSYPVPADAERILARIADLPDELPTGHQAIKLIAVGKSGSLRATVTMQMQGRSAGAKRATDDMIQHARAMNATLGGMESSMASMAARAQAADQSAAASEARAREMQNAQFELVQFCQKMVLERQAEQAKLEEAKARSETFKMLGAQAAPYVGPLMNVALEWWSTKRDKEKAELERIRNAGKHETPETHDHDCATPANSSGDRDSVRPDVDASAAAVGSDGAAAPMDPPAKKSRTRKTVK